MEIIMPVGGAGYFNNPYQQDTNSESNMNFDFNNYSMGGFSYPTISQQHQQHQMSHDQQQDQQRFDQNVMSSRALYNQQKNQAVAADHSNNNFTGHVQYNQPRSGPISNSQLEYNFQFPTNTHNQAEAQAYQQPHHHHQPQEQFQHHQQQFHQQQHQQLRLPLPPHQYSQIQTPTNIIPQSNHNFQYSSSVNQDYSNDQSPLYAPQQYQQAQSTSYFPQYNDESKSFSFNDPFANKVHNTGKVEEFTDDDVQILKSLLFNGEKVKWKYVSSKLANVTGRRATSTACSKKTREIFRLPSEQASGDLGTSLPYVVHNSWKALEQRR